MFRGTLRCGSSRCSWVCGFDTRWSHTTGWRDDVYSQGRWKVGLKPPIFFSPHKNFDPPFNIVVHPIPIAIQRWFMASVVIRFFLH